MQRVWPCLLVLIFLPGAIRSQTVNDESKIIALENLWNQMQLHHDAGAMEKILDPDFVLTDYDGAVLSKSQFLASVRDVSDQLTVEISEDMKLHRHGDTVVVTGATHEKEASTTNTAGVSRTRGSSKMENGSASPAILDCSPSNAAVC
jgi:Domain of unknown function (DUF4440)